MKDCPVCACAAHEPVLSVRGVPTNCSILYPSKESAARVRRGDLNFRFCTACGFLFNASFDPSLLTYDPSYDNSLCFSPLFQDYSRTLARRLIDTYQLRRKEIVEIGCGGGEFLVSLCELGENRGVGFDPAYSGQSDAGSAGRVRFVRDYFSDSHSLAGAGLVCSRHVFEHVPDPRSLVSVLRRGVAGNSGTVLYIEVPNGEAVLNAELCWDLPYEHCSIFTAPALRHLFEAGGFRVVNIGTSYRDEFLYLEAVLGASAETPHPPGEEVEALRDLVHGFRTRFEETVSTWSGFLADAAGTGRRVALWGAGAKSVIFLNLVPGAQSIGAVTDLNPRKYGKFIPGTQHQILSPDCMKEFRPDTVLLTNPIYEAEVRDALRGMGIGAEVVVAAPRRNLMTC